MKLSKIAAATGARLEGDDLEVSAVAGIEQARAGELTFVSNPKYISAARNTRAAALIVTNEFPALDRPTLRTRDPYLTFARALELFYRPPRYAPGVHPTAVIHESARIGSNASIAPYVVVDADARIGDNCV